MSQEVERLRDKGAYAGHHGDCVGADSDFHDICTLFRLWTVIHPPRLDRLRAFRRGNEIRVVDNYHPRNRAIVDETDVLIACPNDRLPHTGSGTWYTIGYAEKKGKEVLVIHPNAMVNHINA